MHLCLQKGQQLVDIEARQGCAELLLDIAHRRGVCVRRDKLLVACHG